MRSVSPCAVFFLGAPGIQMEEYGDLGAVSHGTMLVVFCTHGLISVLLLGGLWASRVWRKERS